MTRLRSKLGEAMRPRKAATNAATQHVDSRFDKADQLMAQVEEEKAVSLATEPEIAQPTSGAKPKGGKRVIRDTFSLPPSDYERIEVLRSRARRKDVEVS